MIAWWGGSLVLGRRSDMGLFWWPKPLNLLTWKPWISSYPKARFAAAVTPEHLSKTAVKQKSLKESPYFTNRMNELTAVQFLHCWKCVFSSFNWEKFLPCSKNNLNFQIPFDPADHQVSISNRFCAIAWYIGIYGICLWFRFSQLCDITHFQLVWGEDWESWHFYADCEVWLHKTDCLSQPFQ